MATASRQTYRRHDGIRPPNVRLNRFIGRRVITFPTLLNMATVRHLAFAFFFILDRLCGSITLSKFGVDPFFDVGDIAVL